MLFLLLGGAGTGGYLALCHDPLDSPEAEAAMKQIAPLVGSVRASSFPQLKDAEIALLPIHSNYIYLEGRFTLSSYFFSRKLSYLIRFNPDAIARNVPPDGLRAIVAHELSHIDYFHSQSRMGMVSLVRLLWASYNARFERGADLETIALGYGPGLESYRTWLYRNIPSSRMEEKKRDYFSPEEIEAILKAWRKDPQIMAVFSACVPRNLAEIEREALNPAASCTK